MTELRRTLATPLGCLLLAQAFLLTLPAPASAQEEVTTETELAEDTEVTITEAPVAVIESVTGTELTWTLEVGGQAVETLEFVLDAGTGGYKPVFEAADGEPFSRAWVAEGFLQGAAVESDLQAQSQPIAPGALPPTGFDAAFLVGSAELGSVVLLLQKGTTVEVRHAMGALTTEGLSAGLGAVGTLADDGRCAALTAACAGIVAQIVQQCMSGCQNDIDPNRCRRQCTLKGFLIGGALCGQIYYYCELLRHLQGLAVTVD